MADFTPESELPDFTSSWYIGTIVHFYRGEMSRMLVWRGRFDATTNWAVIITGSLVAYAVGNPEWSNDAIVVNLAVLGFFAFLEARRFRFYDAYRMRVRMLEVHFIAPVLLGNDQRLLEGAWRQQLASDLIVPTFKCSLLFALGRRCKRVYFALHGFVIFVWCVLVVKRAEAATFYEAIEAFRVEGISGRIVLSFLALFYTVVILLIVHSGAFRLTSGEARYQRELLEWDA